MENVKDGNKINCLHYDKQFAYRGSNILPTDARIEVFCKRKLITERKQWPYNYSEHLSESSCTWWSRFRHNFLPY